MLGVGPKHKLDCIAIVKVETIGVVDLVVLDITAVHTRALVVVHIRHSMVTGGVMEMVEMATTGMETDQMVGMVMLYMSVEQLLNRQLNTTVMPL